MARIFRTLVNMAAELTGKFRRITTNNVYFPELDGIRFLAISMVVFFHIYGYFTARCAAAYIGAKGSGGLNILLENGRRGVQLFFVLSGFILSMPFAHYRINNGRRPGVLKYYIRRVTRLQPPYIIAMLGIFACDVLLHKAPTERLAHRLVATLIYSHHFFHRDLNYLSALIWSLKVEMQFYLIAPILFLLFRLPYGMRRVALTVLPLAIILINHTWLASNENVYMHLQYFLCGMLLADLYVSGTATAVMHHYLTIAAAAILVVMISLLPFYDHLYAAILFPYAITAFYYIILKNEFVKNIFSYRFVPVVGGMCYSIYLIHYSVISLAGNFTMRLHITNYYLPNLLLQLVVLSAASLPPCMLYYYYIERPFMSPKWLNLFLPASSDKGNREARDQ